MSPFVRRVCALTIILLSLLLAPSASTASVAAPGSSASPTASCNSAVSWQRAGNYIGRVIAVKGRVVGSHYASSSRGRPTFLNFRRPYKGAFTAVIWGDQRALFGGFPEDLFLGKLVCVTGKVTWYQGPQIVLRRQSQIRILR